MLGVPPPTGPADPALVEAFRRALSDERGLVPVPVGADALDGAAVIAALVDVAPDAVRRHQRLGLSPDVTRATLADVGRKHALYGAETVTEWMLSLLRADVVSVGRLQVERRSSMDGHALHVPETGPLTPDSVDRSLAEAHALFGATRFSCTSWLLDPVLVERLPQSNIAAFARRFHVREPAAGDAAGDEAVSKFVFGVPAASVRDPHRVTATTHLERVVVERLRTGHHWRQPTGVIAGR